MIREANYRRYNQVKFYFGIVNEVLDNYSIRFRIPNIIDNLNDDEYPIAHPLLKHSSEIFKNDTVIVMQLDIDMQDFVYFSNDVTTFTGLRYGHDIIDLSLGWEDNPSLSIKVAELKQDDKEEGEEWEVLGPYTDITLSNESITITKATPDENDKQGDKQNVVVTISNDGIDAVVNNDNKQERSHVTVSSNGEISVDAKPEGGSSEGTFKSKEIDLKAGNNTTLQMEDNTPKIELKAGENQTKATFDGSQGIKLDSVMMSSQDLGALIEMKNAAGNLKGLLDDIWTELSTVNQNMLTLASLCSAIQFVGPGSTTNGTSAAIGTISASVGTINAKKALVGTVLK